MPFATYQKFLTPAAMFEAGGYNLLLSALETPTDKSKLIT